MQSFHGSPYMGSPSHLFPPVHPPCKIPYFCACSIYGPTHHTASLPILPCYANLPECIFPYTSFCAPHHSWTTVKIKRESSSEMSVNILATGTLAHPGKSVNILETDTVTNPRMSVNILAMDTVTHHGMSVNILATDSVTSQKIRVFKYV